MRILLVTMLVFSIGSEAFARKGRSGRIHRNHDGAAGSYKAIINAESKLDSLTSTYSADGGSSSGSESNLGIKLRYLNLLSKGMFVGPVFEYSDASSKVGEFETSSKLTKLGGEGQYMFGNIDKEKNVPFAGGGLAYVIKESGSGEATSFSGFSIAFGGGLHYFLRSHVALTPNGMYVIEQLSGDNADVSTSGLKLAVGLSIFY